MSIAVGEIYTAYVMVITKLGAYENIDEKTTVSYKKITLPTTYVKEIGDFLQVGDEVKVKVLNVAENGKVGLSIKKAQPPAPKQPPQPQPIPSDRFEDKLAEFMKNSNEKLTQLKRHQEGRRR